MCSSSRRSWKKRWKKRRSGRSMVKGGGGGSTGVDCKVDFEEGQKADT